MLSTFHLSTESMNEEISQLAQNLRDLESTNFQTIDIESIWLVQYPSIASIRHTVKLKAGILGSVQNDQVVVSVHFHGMLLGHLLQFLRQLWFQPGAPN